MELLRRHACTGCAECCGITVDSSHDTNANGRDHPVMQPPSPSVFSWELKRRSFYLTGPWTLRNA